ncbi:MAG: RecX family transcriptional regulator [Odoribacteraceae bacterium]|jgi:regulatory protein|nr:RecX family transcriptional regulator [Odoribacteraceae bacterium]
MMEADRALRLIAARCARRELSCFEVTAWLRRQGLTGEEVAKGVAYLRERGFVDDERFAMAYARDMFRFRRWGRGRIEQGLRRKGIDGELLARALATVGDDDVFAACLLLLQRKAAGVKERDPRRRRAKLIRFALGRGFDFDTIYRALKGVTGEDFPEDEGGGGEEGFSGEVD